MIKEACVETLQQGIRAEQLGADQLELCSRLDLDGLTPGHELTKNLLSKVNIPVKVMIRPRGGDFVYSNEEIEWMAGEIKRFKIIGVSGIVIGALDTRNKIDEHTTQVLARIAMPLSVTYHKAIDETPNLMDSMRLLDQIEGITHVLTSGGSKTAEKGSDKIREMINLKTSLQIIVAGKVTNKNLKSLDAILGAQCYHGKMIVGDLT